MFENMLVRYRGIDNKGVLDRPWTKWRVLRATSSTLKCQFTGNHEFEKIQNIGDPGSIKLRNVFPLISVLPKIFSIAIWGNNNWFLDQFLRFSFFPIRY